MKWLPFFMTFCCTISVAAVINRLFYRFYHRGNTHSDSQYNNIIDCSFGSREHTTVGRGVAILLIILSHIMGQYGNGVRIFTPCGGVGTAIFLIISGYGLRKSWSINGRHKWWTKRIISIYIPYLIVQVLLYWRTNYSSLRGVVFDFLLLDSKHPNGWYLRFLIVWYITFFAVFVLNFLNDKKYYLLMVVALVFLWKGNVLEAEQAFSFIAGVIIAEKSIVVKMLQKKETIIGHFTVGMMFLLLKQVDLIRQFPMPILNFINIGIKLPMALSIIGVLYIILKKRRLLFMYLLGLISYELYLIHPYLMQFKSDELVLFREAMFLASSFTLAYILWKFWEYCSDKTKKHLGI